jgi:hypothetical protein
MWVGASHAWTICFHHYHFEMPKEHALDDAMEVERLH